MAAIGTRQPGHERFWDRAEPHLAEGRLVEGTMMGHQCLRSGRTGGFVATVARATGDTVVKLPRERVTELIDAGVGRPFAPAGKVFREWVAIPDLDDETWAAVLDESLAFVDGAT